MPKVKKVPLRMCIGCQEMKPKRELTRVVRTPQETVEIDPTGKKSGRGAYICPNLTACKRPLKGKDWNGRWNVPSHRKLLKLLSREW
ncbi:hypothetical protein P378_06300 [Desulforamulus profundi]|uniref:YlxR domain-containing protein n=1 Tax=Desulforamulus profundi TaxID=1383067 RepID=A0A2C6M9D6_9FIRM|nr:hypothetical protein P378_06300 [Desulforamulus profundi]